MLHWTMDSSIRTTDQRPLTIHFDGAVVTRGAFPLDQPPQFSIDGHGGVWGGVPFVNLVRNPSADEGWPGLRPWFDERLSGYIHRSPSEVLAAAFDVRRMGPIIAGTVMPWVLSCFFTGLSWGQIRVSGTALPYIGWLFALAAMLGCCRWLLGPGRRAGRGIRPALVSLGAAAAIVLFSATAWSLPHIEPLLVLPSGRYAFPAIAPLALALAGGWWALWPRRARAMAILFVAACLVGFDLVSILTIIAYYRA
jgi:hypothetical protein